MSWFPVAGRSGESRSQRLAYPALTSTSKFLLDGIEFAIGLEGRARDAHLGLMALARPSEPHRQAGRPPPPCGRRLAPAITPPLPALPPPLPAHRPAAGEFSA